MEQATIDAYSIQTILEETFPIQSEIVGTENLKDICTGHHSFDEDHGGFHMDVGGAVEFLANATSIVTFVWQLFSAQSRREPPPVEEIDVFVMSRVVQDDKSPSAEDRYQLYAIVWKRYAARS